MASSKGWWLLLALLVLLADVTSFSPTLCSCVNEKHTYRCSGCSQLPDIPAGVTRLNMSGNNVSRLHFAVTHSSALSDLKIVYMNSNNISALYDGDICPLKNLMILDLSDNNLQDIKENSIACSRSLTRLVLDNNRRLKQVALRSKFLQVLYVQNCGLTNFDPELLKHLPKLRELHLSGNDALTPHDVQAIKKRWPKINITYDSKPIVSVTTTDRSKTSSASKANTSPRSATRDVASDYDMPQVPICAVDIGIIVMLSFLLVVLGVVIGVVLAVVVFRFCKKPARDEYVSSLTQYKN